MGAYINPSLLNSYANPPAPPMEEASATVYQDPYQTSTVDDATGETSVTPSEMAMTMGPSPDMSKPQVDEAKKQSLMTALIPMLFGGAGMALGKKHPGMGALLGGAAKGFADSKHEQIQDQRKKDFEMESFQIKEAHDLVQKLEGFNLDKLEGVAPRGILEGIHELSQKYNEALANDGKISGKEATQLLGYASPLRSWIDKLNTATLNQTNTETSKAATQAQLGAVADMDQAYGIQPEQRNAFEQNKTDPIGAAKRAEINFKREEMFAKQQQAIAVAKIRAAAVGQRGRDPRAIINAATKTVAAMRNVDGSPMYTPGTQEFAAAVQASLGQGQFPPAAQPRRRGAAGNTTPGGVSYSVSPQSNAMGEENPANLE